MIEFATTKETLERDPFWDGLSGWMRLPVVMPYLKAAEWTELFAVAREVMATLGSTQVLVFRWGRRVHAAFRIEWVGHREVCVWPLSKEELAAHRGEVVVQQAGGRTWIGRVAPPSRPRARRCRAVVET
jgi:hypothetical protein